MKSPRSIQQKILLDALLVAVLAGLLAFGLHTKAALPGHNAPSIFGGLYVLYLGVLFLLSYFYPDASYVLRALIWTCEHLSRPRGRRMAFFYFGLSVLFGVWELLAAFGVLR